MNNKGFSLITVLVLSLVMFLIGGTGLYIAATNFRATRADINLNIAEKASNAGLLNAFDDINMKGTGAKNEENEHPLGNASYKTKTTLGGKNVWFVSSQGVYDRANVVKTAMFQGYYGVGLYTVRGQVDADLNGARLSGCDMDSTVASNCYVPAFIAFTTKIPSSKPQTCTDKDGKPVSAAVDGKSDGVYGNPATYNLDQGDLSKIFFKVKCFNKFNNAGCKVSLLDYLENDYGWNSSHTEQQMFFQQTGANANSLGIPVVNLSPPDLPASGPGACVYSLATGLNLAATATFKDCKDIVITSTPVITGNGIRSGKPVKIYAYGGAPTFSNASNFKLYTTTAFTVTNSSDFAINGASDNAINTGNSNFTINTTGNTVFKGANIGFVLNTTGTTTLSGTIGAAAYPFRIVSTNKITAEAEAVLTNGTLITGPVTTNVANNEGINLSSSPQNLEAKGNVTFDNVNIFARKLDFAEYSNVRILNSLVYVYAHACPECSRSTSNSSLVACDQDSGWCGWYGKNISLNIGRASDGTAKPVLFISNNTSVKVQSPRGVAYTWGVWYGEDVTYLIWKDQNGWDFSGFLIRNFPPDLVLGISLKSSKIRLNFSKSVIDAISGRYRFFRQVECVRDPLTPKAQMIQTRMTNY